MKCKCKEDGQKVLVYEDGTIICTICKGVINLEEDEMEIDVC